MLKTYKVLEIIRAVLNERTLLNGDEWVLMDKYELVYEDEIGRVRQGHICNRSGEEPVLKKGDTFDMY